MLVKELNIRGFRSINELSLEFEPGITTIVGENGAGKSTVATALDKLWRQCLTGGDVIGNEDYPYGDEGLMAIEACIDLSPTEIEDSLIRYLVPTGKAEPLDLTVHGWLNTHLADIRVVLQRPDGPTQAALVIGDISLVSDQLYLGPPTSMTGGQRWMNVADDVVAGQPTSSAGVFSLDVSVADELLADRLKTFAEFRVRASQARSDATESFNGSDTASALLNLKIHENPEQRARYALVKETFENFFPRYRIEAVERSPGSREPDIQFYEGTSPERVSHSQVSGGIHEMLTMITSLMARDGLVIIIEHPETHLHPHAMRALSSLLVKASERNQIIVTTHDPHFVNPNSPQELRRIWWSAGDGTQARSIGQISDDRQLGQMATALRLLGTREMVFARAVLLVEDETQQGFLTSIARTLEHDTDSHSVSIIEVGSENGFKPFWTLLEGLGIPYACLRDNPWGDDHRYPPDRFFSIGNEIEEYLDDAGLGALRQETIREVGSSKRRVGSALGAKLARDQIPSIFDTVLITAINLATGEPVPKPSPD